MIPPIDDKDSQKSSKKNGNGKVIPIKSTRKSQDSNPKKDKYRNIHAQVVDSMLGNHGRLPPFPVKLHRWVDHEGSSLIYKESADRSVGEVVSSTVDHEISNYWEYVADNTDNFWGQITADDATKIRKLWFARSSPNATIWPPMTMADDNRSSLVKLPWGKSDVEGFTYDSFKHLPCFYKIMTHITDHKILMEWIGSIFDPNSQRQQYAWLYGEGGDGKGCIVDAISQVMGSAMKIEQNFNAKDKFWSYFVKDKRLLVFPDVDDDKMVSTGLWKSLTGEDDLRMEIKGGNSFTRRVSIKCLVMSNEKPRISSKRADIRRALVFSAFGKFTDDGGDFKQRLQAENVPFLKLCYKMYLDKINGNSRYQFVLSSEEGKSRAEEIAEENELELDVFASDYIEVVDSKESYITCKRMKELMIHADFKSQFDRQLLHKYLERKHGIVRKEVKCKKTSKPIKCWINCIEKPL